MEFGIKWNEQQYLKGTAGGDKTVSRRIEELTHWKQPDLSSLYGTHTAIDYLCQ